MQLLIQRNDDDIRLFAADNIHIDAVMRQEIVDGKLAVVDLRGGLFMQHSGDLNVWRTVDRRYSPPIDIRLLTDCGEAIEVAQAGPESLILRGTQHGCSPGVRAWIVMTVDGRIKRSRVTLPDGVDSRNQRVKIERDLQ